jgi:uncharacterized coiled-coil protein SlyX
MPDHTVRIETPAANELPALHAKLSEAMERLATLEERTRNPDPAITAASDLASTSAREVATAKKQIAALQRQVKDLEDATLEPVETVDDPKPVPAANEVPQDNPKPAPIDQPQPVPAPPLPPPPPEKPSLLKSIFG